jgi:hypothetical protein
VDAEIAVKTVDASPKENARQIIDYLIECGYLQAL